MKNENLTMSVKPDEMQGYRLYKKTEKISKGLFLATQHIPDTSSLKRYIRDNAICLIESTAMVTLQMDDIDRQDNDISIASLRSKINKNIQVTMSYIDLAQTSGQMSYKNAGILSDNIISYKNEINVFMDTLEQYILSDTASIDELTYGTDNAENRHLDRYPQVSHKAIRPVELSDSFFENDDFGVTEPLPLPDTVGGDIADTSDKGDTSDTSDTVDTSSTSVTRTTLSDIKSHKKDISDRSISHAPLSPQKTIIQKFSGSRDDLHSFLNSMHQKSSIAPKNDRQKVIVDTIKEKGELSIKDLTDVIHGCSEKTIQRELISLVSDGVLSKTGERRWSRYSLMMKS
jgi:hypothetical protein